LLFGSARPAGKGAAVIEPAVRGAWGLSGGVSADEAHFFRGGAIEARAGPVAVVAFGSHRTATPLLTAGGELRGIDLSGYHRTPAEVGRRGMLTDRSAGGGLRLSIGEWLSVGGAFISTSLAMPASSRVTETPGGPGGPQRTAFRRGSIDVRANAGGVTLFGEGLPTAAEVPWIAGALFAGPSGRLVIVRRYYPPADALRGTSGFADAPGGSNEQGTYAGAEAAIVPGLLVSAFLDLSSRIRPVQGSVHPPGAIDRLVSVRYDPATGVSAELRFRLADGEAGVSDVGPGPLTVPGNGERRQQRLRAEVRWTPGPGTACGIRLDHCADFPAGGTRATGAMASADFTVEPWRGLTIDATARFFRTDSYASGIPVVEGDYPGTVASTVYSGEGSGWSAGWAWRWSRQARLSFRYSVLRRDDLRRIGTGPAELPSNIREKAGVQLDLAI